MSRIGLAFSSFFRLLFGKRLSPKVAPYLPEELKALPAPAAPAEAKPAKADAKPAKAEPRPEVRPEVRPDAKPEPRPEPRDERPKKADLALHHRDGALALLALLQREGRFIDFAREALETFNDAEIGAAARDVHRGCKKVLDQCFTFEAVMPGQEDTRVSVPKGFDPAEVRLIGEAKGEPPFGGTLRHHGWRATRAQLPALTEGLDRAVVAPAEVEVS
ncbi:MAG TPA: DUF2760 domain-containing protein [Kofleriaceae bacterium]|nr:DUF2760 domain-containing protein [Kofleriaceae bacterium]